MSDRPARRVVETLLTIPWALDPEYARRMLAIATRRHDPAALAAEVGTPLERSHRVTIREGVATVPITGPMFRYANLFAEISGATSYEALAQDLTQALADPQVHAILLDIDSPGGEVFGASELSDLLYNARGTKPIVAHVGGFCASAALWIASAADRIVASPVALMGSVGAMMSVTAPAEDQPDLGGEQEIEFVSSQSPDKNLDPRSKAGREQYQAIVDAIAGVFAGDLGRNLDMDPAAVWEQFGHGRLFVGAQAQARGLAHELGECEQTHRQLVADRTQMARRMLPAHGRDRAVPPATTARALAALFGSLKLASATRSVLGRPRISQPPRTTGVGVPVGMYVRPTDGKTYDSFEECVLDNQWADDPEAYCGSIKQGDHPGGSAAGPSPAPKADSEEDRRMPESTGAAPDTGAKALADFKARLAEISNICAAAGHPELAVEYAQGDESIGSISAKLLATRKTEAAPDPLKAAMPAITKVEDREAQKPFGTLGEQLQAIVAAGAPSGTRFGDFRGGSTDKRLLHINAAASGGAAGVGSDGGFLIQKDFAPELMKEGFESGALISRCSPHEVSAQSDGLEVPYVDETSRATGSRWGGVQIYRRAEADTVTAKRPKMGNWECRLEDLMGLAYMTERLLQDAPAMQQVYEEAFAEEFGFVADDEIYRGTGVGQMLGILNADCTVTVAKESGQLADTIVAENISKIWARVLPRSKPRGIWVINTECSPQLDQLQIGTGVSGQLVYMPAGGLADTPYGRLKGRPVIEIEQASALGDVGDIAYLDLSQFKVISKGGIRAEDSIHVRFIYDERCFKWVARVNGKPKLKSAITPYKGASTLSPFVTLAARA